MPFSILSPGDPRIRSEITGPDKLVQQQVEHFRRKDAPAEFRFHSVKVQDGAKASVEVKIRYPVDQPFAFACYGDQAAAVQERAESEWRALAMAALQRFAAVKERDIKLGPIPEDTRPLNYKVELMKPVERSAASIKMEEEAEAERRNQKIQAAMKEGDLAALRELGVTL